MVKIIADSLGDLLQIRKILVESSECPFAYQPCLDDYKKDCYDCIKNEIVFLEEEEVILMKKNYN